MIHQLKVELQETIREREREREREIKKEEDKNKKSKKKRYNNKHKIIQVMLYNRITLKMTSKRKKKR